MPALNVCKLPLTNDERNTQQFSQQECEFNIMLRSGPDFVGRVNSAHVEQQPRLSCLAACSKEEGERAGRTV